LPDRLVVSDRSRASRQKVPNNIEACKKITRYTEAGNIGVQGQKENFRGKLVAMLFFCSKRTRTDRCLHI